MDRSINSIIPVGPLPLTPAKTAPASSGKNKPVFEKVLQRELEDSRELRFSAHAEKRLKERNIVLAREDLTRIGSAVKKAEAKGARESLIIYGDLALITSIKNKTVITAMDGNSTADHVFTNIDSAVIVK